MLEHRHLLWPQPQRALVRLISRCSSHSSVCISVRVAYNSNTRHTTHRIITFNSNQPTFAVCLWSTHCSNAFCIEILSSGIFPVRKCRLHCLYPFNRAFKMIKLHTVVHSDHTLEHPIAFTWAMTFMK